MNHKDFGNHGEELAVAHLIDQGYDIIQVNYRIRTGEVDIVAKDGEYLCFVEVKTRHNDEFGSPFEAITPSKQRRIIKLAKLYLMENKLTDISIRFDVIGIMVEFEDKAKIELIKDAFWA
ncbi:MAG: YraN family protein [Candidatus Omnitrophica bacterium]|nr:YraN family protein [Candidatus Omnitrophota bacterium]